MSDELRIALVIVQLVTLVIQVRALISIKRSNKIINDINKGSKP